MILHTILGITIGVALAHHYHQKHGYKTWAFWWRYLTWVFILAAFASTPPIHFFS